MPVSSGDAMLLQVESGKLVEVGFVASPLSISSKFSDSQPQVVLVIGISLSYFQTMSEDHAPSGRRSA